METSDGGIWSVVPYGSFTAYTPALPQFYWDVYSAEQRIKHLCMELHKLVCYADMLGKNINLDHREIEQLQKELEDLKNGGLLDYYEKQIYQWIQDNMADIMSAACKQVFFGLTDDGYFCAYIPDSWSDIEFDTGVVFGRSDYGRLILRYKTQGQGVIDNTYGYSLAQVTQGQKAIADIESSTNRGELAYNTLFSNLAATEVSPFGEVQQQPKPLTPDRGDI